MKNYAKEKMMKKILIATTLIVTLTTNISFALNQAFTLDEFNDNCPAPESLTFTAVSASPNSDAYMKGTAPGGDVFYSYNINTKSNLTLSPQDIDSIDAAPRSVGENNHGHISGDLIACFYSYKGFTGAKVSLVMDNEHSSL